METAPMINNTAKKNMEPAPMEHMKTVPDNPLTPATDNPIEYHEE